MANLDDTVTVAMSGGQQLTPRHTQGQSEDREIPLSGFYASGNQSGRAFGWQHEALVHPQHYKHKSRQLHFL